MAESFASVAFEAIRDVDGFFVLVQGLQFVAVGALEDAFVELFFQLAQACFFAEDFYGLVGFFTVVADGAEEGLFAFHEGDLGEGGDFVLIVYLLVDDVPDEEEMVDMRVCAVGEEVVQQQLRRHELRGVHEYYDQGGVGVQQVVQLLLASQVFHL